jgi:hypothetical protein
LSRDAVLDLAPELDGLLLDGVPVVVTDTIDP